MAKFKLGKTPEELRKEAFEKQRALEEEILRKAQLQEKKVQELKKKNKRKTILVFASLGITLLSLLTFGTYNTFFKEVPTETDIVNIIDSSVIKFPIGGVEGFVRKNFTKWFSDLSVFGDSGIEYVKPNLNTLSIDQIQEQSSTFAKVYFSIDLETKMKDKKGEKDTIVAGEKKVNRYNFFIPIEYYSQTGSNGNLLGLGYRPTALISFYNLASIDQSEPTVAPHMAFSTEPLSAESVTAMKTKIDRILSNLYSGKDVSREFLTRLPLATQELTYQGIIDFKAYGKDNQSGFNSTISYRVRTKEGFDFIINSYLAIQPSGNSWIIKGIQ